MDHQADPQWLSWTKRLQAIAQTGLTFTRDHYDQERYEELREVAAEMMAAGAGMLGLSESSRSLPRGIRLCDPEGRGTRRGNKRRSHSTGAGA